MSEPERLEDPVREAIAVPENDILVSAVSVWEIAIKQALGRIRFPIEECPDLLRQMGLMPLQVSVEHAIAAGALPHHHNDPFDRMLMAQAQVENLTLVTVDVAILRYGVPVFSAGRR